MPGCGGSSPCSSANEGPVVRCRSAPTGGVLCPGGPPFSCFLVFVEFHDEVGDSIAYESIHWLPCVVFLVVSFPSNKVFDCPSEPSTIDDLLNVVESFILLADLHLSAFSVWLE